MKWNLIKDIKIHKKLICFFFFLINSFQYKRIWLLWLNNFLEIYITFPTATYFLFIYRKQIWRAKQKKICQNMKEELRNNSITRIISYFGWKRENKGGGWGLIMRPWEKKSIDYSITSLLFFSFSESMSIR